MNETTESVASEDPHLKEGWRPITTAPRNGARIWLFAPHIRESAVNMRGWFDLQDGIDAGRWYEDPDFGTRPSGWTSPQVGWKQDNSEIMASNQDCYLYWKPITRAEELELAAIEGWKACMRSVESAIESTWEYGDLISRITEIASEGPCSDYEMTKMFAEFRTRSNPAIQAELDALMADVDSGRISVDQMMAFKPTYRRARA